MCKRTVTEKQATPQEEKSDELFLDATANLGFKIFLFFGGKQVRVNYNS